MAKLLDWFISAKLIAECPYFADFAVIEFIALVFEFFELADLLAHLLLDLVQFYCFTL